MQEKSPENNWIKLTVDQLPVRVMLELDCDLICNIVCIVLYALTAYNVACTLGIGNS